MDLQNALKKHAKMLNQDENFYANNELVLEESKKGYNIGEEFSKLKFYEGDFKSGKTIFIEGDPGVGKSFFAK
jgi:DNA replication protein DnaC